MVRTYRNKHQSNALKQAYREAARDGLVVESAMWQEGKSGCLRFILFGPLAFFWRPSGELTVNLEVRKAAS